MFTVILVIGARAGVGPGLAVVRREGVVAVGVAADELDRGTSVVGEGDVGECDGAGVGHRET